jgi:hypothetical protein
MLLTVEYCRAAALGQFFTQYIPTTLLMSYLKLNLLYFQIMLQFYTARQLIQPVQQALQVDLGNIREWVCLNKLVLNTNKTKVCMIRKIAKYLPGRILRQTTQALIGSQVNYCSVVWGNASASEIRRLQIAQNKAAKDCLKVDIWLFCWSHAQCSWLVINQQDN